MAKSAVSKHDARTPFATRTLHGMGNTDAGIDTAIDSKGRKDIGIGRYAGFQNCGRKAVEGQGDVSAHIAVETPRDPPESRAQNSAAEQKRKTQQQEHVSHLMAEFPDAQFGVSLPVGGLHDAVFRLAEKIETALDKQIERERKAGDAIGEDAVVDVAAAGVVPGQRRRLLPCLAAAAGVLVVAVGERLMRGDPKTLGQKKGKQDRRDPLREIEVEAAKASKSVSHQKAGKDISSLNG